MTTPGTSLDPGCQRVLDLIAASGRQGMADGTVEEARAVLRFAAFDILKPHHVIQVGPVTQIKVPVSYGRMDARVYRPPGPPNMTLPTVVFAHGGGYVLGDLDTHDNQARRLCRDADCVVVSVAYRLAPEDPWPAGRDDVITALRWVVANIDRFGGDRSRVAVAGDSAGGCFAALAALAARDQGIDLCAQLLLYPSTDMRDEEQWPSRVENAHGLFLTAADLRWFEERHIPVDADRSDPGLSPLLADHAGVAPAVVVTAQHDPLRDEGNAYAVALRAAGVEVDHVEVPRMIHGFFDMWRASSGVEDAVADVIARFRRMLWGGLA